ncbi:hypothetical protein H6P81_006615 [Aristolochia fimbriata]|uniref:Uncharacterized protein n=1 Tax=Aristolochia fimbriata TaxID=158543 RepID=A0AAV7EZ11_ARIFI|nr:hypothetical protein H6P81_006615 [Aristolochia fimbriata]
MSLYLPNAQARFFPLSFSSSQFSSSPKIRRFFSHVSWSNSLHSCPCKLTSFSEAFPHSAADEENVIGDCLVFEDGAFEDPFPPAESHQNSEKPRRPKKPPAVKEVDLIPEEWKEVQAEINLSKKDRRKIAQKLEYGSRIERTKTVRLSDLEEYKSERATKLSQLKPVVLEKPREPQKETMDDSDEDDEVEPASSSSGRVVPKNPRALEKIAKGSMEDISKLFTSGDYEPPEDDGRKTSEGRRKLFTKEEKVLLNRRIPNLFVANSSKCVDINAVDKNDLTALHRAILCKKQAIANYLLRESANPFVRDEDTVSID